MQWRYYADLDLDETKLKISIEAGSSDCWRKYIGDLGMTFGIDECGKSAPYKDLYTYFGLDVSNITNESKRLFTNL